MSQHPDNQQGQPARKGGQQRGGRRDLPTSWEVKAWTYKEIEAFKETAAALEKWGRPIAEAIESTEDVTRAQRSFIKKFESFEKSFEKGHDAVQRMTEAIDRFGGQDTKWAKSMTARRDTLQKALEGIDQGEGFAAMYDTVRRQRKRDEAAEFAEAISPGGAGGGGRREDYSDFGKAGIVAGGLHRFTSGWELMRLQRLWGMTGAPVFNQFIPAAARTEMTGWQAAASMGGYMPGLPGTSR